MKTLLCCIVKMENNYLTEWISYYKKIGITKIVIYDNNDTEGDCAENLLDLNIIKSGVASKFIDIHPFHNIRGGQLIAYNDCYEKYSSEYDWLMFFDIDEYLHFERHKKIDRFLSEKEFKNFDIIHVCWKLYDDNDLIYVKNNNYSLQKRFTRELAESIPEKYKLNQEIKSIVRGGLDNIQFTKNPHTITSRILNCCNATGEKDDSLSQKTKNISHKGAWLNHYICKTLEEYITNKFIRRGGFTSKQTGRYNPNFFFIYNIKTQEKMNYISEIMKLNLKDEYNVESGTLFNPKIRKIESSWSPVYTKPANNENVSYVKESKERSEKNPRIPKQVTKYLNGTTTTVKREEYTPTIKRLFY